VHSNSTRAHVFGSAPHIPALDGLRGVAVLLVIVFHHTVMRQPTFVDQVYVSIARLGWTGVDLFFVLSGFLITGILYDARGGSHYYRNFYARRTLRIFPLYYAFVAFTLIVAPWLWPDTDLGRTVRRANAEHGQLWYWLYLSNLHFAREEGFSQPNLAVTWSLAIEEQFYLVWPVVVASLTRRRLMWTCAALVGVALAARSALVVSGADVTAAYLLTFCRMDALAVGAFVALALRDPGDARRLREWAPPVVLASTAVFFVGWYAEGPFENETWGKPGVQTAGYTLLALAFGALVALLALDAAPNASRILSTPVLQTFGKYSYALYLFHIPVRRFIRDEYFPVADFPTWMGSPLPGQLLFYIVATAPAFLLAWLSWHLLESRALALKGYFPYERTGRTTL
jgi:peptidoglycan/LPS O-acetylase OafA/YrhL